MSDKSEGAMLLRLLAKKVVAAPAHEDAVLVINAADMGAILWAVVLIDDGNVVWTVERR
mgnify:CR=1 FL=1